MSIRERIIDVFRSKMLTDITVGGWVESEGSKRYFHPILDSVYLEFAGTLIKTCSIRGYGALALQVVEEIACDFPIDEDDEFCTSSLFKLIVKMPDEGSRVLRIEEFYSSEEDPDGGIYKCLGFYLDSKDYIFLDPTNLFGIQIGNSVRKDEWIRDYMLPETKYEQRVCDTRSERVVRAEQIVRRLIRRADPFGLCTLGATEDEFDSEVRYIVRQLDRMWSAHNAQSAVFFAFSFSYGEPAVGTMDYKAIGSNLFLELTEAGLIGQDAKAV